MSCIALVADKRIEWEAGPRGPKGAEHFQGFQCDTVRRESLRENVDRKQGESGFRTLTAQICARGFLTTLRFGTSESASHYQS